MGEQGPDTRQSCYINGRLCINGVREDFENDPLTKRPRPCNKWVCLKGKDPQSERVIDEWCCNEWAKVKLAVENSQMTRFVQASVDKVANEVQKNTVVFVGALPDEARSRLGLNAPHPTTLIEHAGKDNGCGPA